MKKILILTLDAGFGHRRAASAVSDAFQSTSLYEFDCQVKNPVRGKGLSCLVVSSQQHYDTTSRKHRFLYHSIYKISNYFPINIIIDQVITLILQREIEQVIADEKPDGIISTFPFYSTSIKRSLKSLDLNIPFYTVVTDFENVHRLWFHPGPDKYFVATEKLKEQAITTGIAEKKVIVSGIPVDMRIAQETRSKREIRRELGWDEYLPTLVAVGSKRVNNLLEKMEVLKTCEVPFQLCIVAGGDDRLYNAVKNKNWNIPVHSYNYVENIPELLHAADLLITKAGGLIISEGLACSLPIIIIDAISGQETGNVKFLQQTKSGIIITNDKELKSIIENLLKNHQDELNQFSKNASLVGKPEASLQIARQMTRDLQAKNYQPINSTVFVNEHSF